MTVDISAISAFLFISVNKEDPNADIPVDEAREIGTRFINACSEVLGTDFANLDDEQIQFHMYEIGKKHYGVDKKILRQWFKHLYLLLFRTESGPRWGTWIVCFGHDSFKKMLSDRLEKPFYYI